MKYMFASDVHGSAYYCRKMLEAYDKEKAERLVLLGDLLYHGPRNDLPKEYAPKEVIRLLNERKNQIYAVRGTCEAEVEDVYKRQVLDSAPMNAAAAARRTGLLNMTEKPNTCLLYTSKTPYHRP